MIGANVIALCSSIVLAGDPELVASVADILQHRGIETRPDECGLHARLEHRGTSIVVLRGGDVIEERVVSDPETAATVIESWSRNDLTGPLLATHPMETMTTPRAIGVRESIPTSYQPPRGVHVFAHAETSFAGDQTVWIGVAVGVCIQVGRACVSARGRFAAVVDGPNRTSIEDITRSAEDALFGGEIPFGIGPTTLWFGFGAGMGAVHTGSTGGAMPLGSETFGLRADTHVGWTIRVIDRLSLELSATLDVAQATDVEGSLSAAAMQEPHLFARFGAGVRIEGL